MISSVLIRIIIGMKHNNSSDKKIALVAGALDLPFYTRDALIRAGWDVYVVGLEPVTLCL